MSSTPLEAHQKQIRALKDLRKTIHINDFGLPTGIYRVDLLPFHDYEPDASQASQVQEEPQVVGGLAAPSSMGAQARIQSTSPTPLPRVNGGVDPEGSSLFPATVDQNGGALEVIEDRVAGFRSQDLDCAFEPLEYGEGFPTFRNGDPFWLQLVCEPPEAYMAFQRYLQMSATTPADVPQSSAHNTLVQDTKPVSRKDRIAGATGFRSLALLAAYMTQDDNRVLQMQEKMKVWAELYYWEWRAKAYDLFRVARHRQQQEIRAIETQDSHYSIARRLSLKIMKYIDEDEDFMDQMTPKVALDGLKLATSLERVSVGLPAAGPNRSDGPESGAGASSMEFTMRRVASVTRVQDAAVTEEGDLMDEAGNLLNDALKNPEELRVIQEMILKFHATTGNHGDRKIDP